MPKMKICPWFIDPQAILGGHDILLSEEYNWSYIKKCPGSSKLYNGSAIKCIHPSEKVFHAAPGG